MPKKKLRCYNQYPGLYNSVVSMTQDLRRIAMLGFKQVWMNPFYTPCEMNPIPNMAHRTRCPYAMKDEKTLYTRYGQSLADIKAYTYEARRLGLEPMFDLVARHVAIDHRFVAGCPTLMNKGIDTRRWFKRHQNGNLVMFGMDEDYRPNQENPWCDVAAFDYDDAETAQEIIDHFWKPFLYQNIVTLGFQGARLDAPSWIPHKVLKVLCDYIREICKEHHGTEAVILAETVGIKYLDKDLKIGPVADFVMNSCYFMPERSTEGNEQSVRALWTKPDNWLSDSKKKLRELAPTVGFAGSHDEPRYTQKVIDAGITDKKMLATAMRVKLAVAALSSDGGWLLAYGDEFGSSRRVDLFDPTPCAYHLEKATQNFDVQPFVRELNHLLFQMPFVEKSETNERIFLEKFPDVVIFIHYRFDGTMISIANADPDRTLQVDNIILKRIIESAQFKEKFTNGPATRIHACGSVELATNLTRLLRIDLEQNDDRLMASSCAFFERTQSERTGGAASSSCSPQRSSGL